MSTDRTGGISIVGRGEIVTTSEEIDRGDRLGRVELLGGGVCLEHQSLVCLVEKKRQEVYPGVVTFDGSIAGEEGQEDRMVVEVRGRELMMCSEWFCKWEEKTEGRRQRGGVSYSPLM